ncbi:P-loop NTPase family protein [Tautonia sociabilis]|uniref:Gfo/Idh/MocA family oxidoreductase n=1 Tax=Tautonia sociabilis TaxID=2080755 RepID=A0A432ML95_9BACT|nr:hypothetical protein [Tautonia sociabilis]RUL87858.1 hypothetical protein TsocGM_10000 [Tautonia sociabilis]
MIDPNRSSFGPDRPLPRSIAIAGAWGYIGRKFLDVALSRGLTVFVFDPGPAPDDIDLGRLTRIDHEADFYRVDADLVHLAVHPEHRRLDLLLDRERPPLILNEKPMAEPGRPEHCRRVVEDVAASPAVVLYDFPELFDPLSARILEYLGRFREVRIDEVVLQRSKDREDPAIPRNAKRMVSIQYQESVHCLAFVLYLLAAVQGGTDRVLNGGVRLVGRAERYSPPNPEAYPHAVDGRCRYRMFLGGVRVEGSTNFKRHAEWAKRRLIRGVGDGEPFEIDVSFLEGKKDFRINGRDQPCDPAASSYQHVLETATRWSRQFDRSQLMGGLFPNPAFTLLTYQLSAALWRSCREREAIAIESADRLRSWDAGFDPDLAPLADDGELDEPWV